MSVAQSFAPMPVTIEVPEPWLKSKRDGDRNSQMFELVKAVTGGYDCTYTPLTSGRTFAPRTAPPGGFCLSYHSVGDARHVWRLKETAFPYFYSFDRLGFSAWSEIGHLPERYSETIDSISLELAANRIRRLALWLRDNNISKYTQPASAFDFAEPFVFLPLQVRNDIVSQFCKLDPIHVLRRAAIFARQARIPLVVKRHPYCKSPVVSAALALETTTNPYVFATKSSVQQILPACMSVLTANSSVGLEALAHEKPVFCFASSEYDFFAFGINTLEDVERAFFPATGSHGHRDKGIRFLFFYLNYMCFDARKAETLERFVSLADFCARNDIWCERSLCDPDLFRFMTPRVAERVVE